LRKDLPADYLHKYLNNNLQEKATVQVICNLDLQFFFQGFWGQIVRDKKRKWKVGNKRMEKRKKIANKKRNV